MKPSQSRKPRLFTLGYADRSFESFIKILEHSSIRLVADVRSNPASARFPQFERHALSSELGKRGVVYRWFRSLGGRRRETSGQNEHTALGEEGFQRYCAAMNTSEFAVSAEALLGLTASTVVGVLSADRDFRSCHRQFLSDKLMVMGARVVHILDSDTVKEHRLHPDLIVEKDRLIYRKRQLNLLE